MPLTLAKCCAVRHGRSSSSHLGMYLVVYGLRNAGLTEYLSGVLNVLADKGLWAATLGYWLPDGFPVFHHEQYAYRAGWRSLY
jgi:hypothetical protein